MTGTENGGIGMWEQVKEYIQNKYETAPEFPWRTYPDFAVFRHRGNHKWFALVMDVPADKLGLPGQAPIPCVNLKIDDPLYRDILLRSRGILPAYHMNKLHWITVLLDGTVASDKVFDLIDASYQATAPAAKKQPAPRPAKEWLVPANPKYYDIEHAFDDAETVNWKQGAGIRKGDTVYMYVGAPISAILYRCRVTETEIPYFFQNENLTITALMTLRLERRYGREEFTFERLGKEFGIKAVRGPRGVTNKLGQALKKG